MDELPYQTWERVTNTTWPGGKSPLIRMLLLALHIHFPSGTASANVRLQEHLIKFDKHRL
jgi:hypothetical protein